ncbi:ABC transporter permease [Cyclobacterium xiamenense]|jgi:Cu-processing system permease protein|uniref:ABC transporter permease n=1 Tax=Cyclobacterium xiamenense TaxID=1297121 RepID=UPI0012B83A2C|nr:ABC transporter permease [Cyclobacterium xiamenense]
MGKIIRFLVTDLSKNKAILLYLLFLWLTGFGLISLQGQGEKTLLALLNISILVVPLVCLVFSIIYFYNMYEFLLLLHAQPLARRTLLIAFYCSLSLVFTGVYLLGLGLPLFFSNAGGPALLLLLTGSLWNLIFIGLALLMAIWAADRTKGMGFSLLIWVYFVLLFDGLVLLLMYNFNAYPIEKFVLYISFLNPLDLGRILVLMQTDAAALMGYSGAVFQQVFTENWGKALVLVLLLLWALVPFSLSIRWFIRKDL